MGNFPSKSNTGHAYLLIQEYQKEFPDIPIGYSGHESGISISVAAVSLGARIIERHVTLDKTWKGSDHAASLEPPELAELVRSIRLVERALGSGLKQMLPCEKPCHDKVILSPQENTIFNVLYQCLSNSGAPTRGMVDFSYPSQK